MEGKILNERYRLDYKVGSGGMADVYRAYDLRLQRVVAVKALKREYCDDPQYLRRFTKEAQAMMALSHKNIVSIYDVGSDGDVHYLVLEYVDGCTLREYMDKHGALKPNIAVKVVGEILDGLDHAHEHGLIHRDVKPQNVMISSMHEIKLADFGIAKFTDSNTRTLEANEALGSVYYISPEQAKGETVDTRTDIYSTGVMLYEMLTGKPPFTGDNAVQIALKHVNEEMKSPFEANDQIPVALSDVVMRSVSKDASARYQRASEMKKALLYALKHPRSRFAMSSKTDDAYLPEETNRAAAFIKKHLGTVAIVACVVAIIGIFAAMMIISLSGSKRNGYRSVPNLIGKTIESAEISANYKGFILEVASYEETENADPGVILRQTPAAQEKAKEGTVIRVVVSAMLETVVVPDITGRTLEDARALLAQYGLTLDEEFVDYAASDAPEGTVIAQMPVAGNTLMIGDGVRVTLSKQPETEVVVIPNLVEQDDIYSAIALLRQSGFDNYRIHIITDSDIISAQEEPSASNSGDDSEEIASGGAGGSAYMPSDTEISYKNMQVIGQSPAAGTEVLYNTELIDIYVYKPTRGEYKHDFSENLNLKLGDSLVVTIYTELGEIVIYEMICSEDIETVPFRGYYWQEGTYTCILYVNGTVNKELSREFIREVPDHD